MKLWAYKCTSTPLMQDYFPNLRLLFQQALYSSKICGVSMSSSSKQLFKQGSEIKVIQRQVVATTLIHRSLYDTYLRVTLAMPIMVNDSSEIYRMSHSRTSKFFPHPRAVDFFKDIHKSFIKASWSHGSSISRYDASSSCALSRFLTNGVDYFVNLVHENRSNLIGEFLLRPACDLPDLSESALHDDLSSQSRRPLTARLNIYEDMRNQVTDETVQGQRAVDFFVIVDRSKDSWSRESLRLASVRISFMFCKTGARYIELGAKSVI
ncbi:uncharacterized protein BYT42DRAFT_603504 [Radiomyces spectabilis]|uniref:uncharacterized protein n=1 Tax=Radiomyces spectabilis TaxID=64574 RepID=UPI00221E7DC5|nr:uncharacterized protein BYT42DRAFT_603504 [Radiomyces spectabilis]KAI8384434.1 hypothetical protein BYT42DRAFT_603504 [Radiomyces spectabilis]